MVETIKATRKAKKIKQKNFAEILGLSKDYVNKVENFKRVPSIKRIVEACDALELELSIKKVSSVSSQQPAKKVDIY